MNANAIVKNYRCLTPEERFRLILAASDRDDDAERERLLRAGQRLVVSIPDHAPYSQAISELSYLTFIELLDQAAGYFDAFARADSAHHLFGDHEHEGDESEAESDQSGPGAGGERPVWQRLLDVALAAGFVLKTKADGWKLFCERLGVPPYLLWQGFPGLERLQRALALADKAAFNSEGFLNWMNRVRPKGQPELVAVALSAEAVAAATEEAFRERVGWWSP